MNANATHLPDASDIGLDITLFRRATPLWMIYDAKLAGEHVVAWRFLPTHVRASEEESKLWPHLPNWVVAGDITKDNTGFVPRMAAYSHKSTSGWLVYPAAPKALEKPLTDRKKMADLANHLLTVLDKLHSRDTLHLDVHPSNIRDHKGKFCLVGLGLDVRKQAGATSGSNEGLARKGYSAPEMWDASGRSKLGPWTDIFAAAATIYYAICGKAPADFRERIDKPRWREAVAYDLNRELAKSGAAWPKMVEFIIAGLAPKIEDRPKTVSEWSRIWKEPVQTSSTGLPFAGPPLAPQSTMHVKHPILYNAGMGALGVTAGGILFFFWLGAAVPVLLELVGMDSYQVKSGYGPSQAFLLFQLFAVLAVDAVLPRLGGFGRSGFLLPAVLGQLVMTNNNWLEGGDWVGWFNVAAFVAMMFSLAENKSEARGYFVKYAPMLLIIGAALSYWDIRSLMDLGL